jgi:mono/diheme cytochrome c family protein
MYRLILVSLCAAGLQACSSQSAVGFRLPTGDAARGREAFVGLQCNSCHQVAGIAALQSTGPLGVTLGGHTVRVETYGDLVTAIINPSHELARGYPVEQISRNGESLMSAAYLNDVMTVQQLVDIVAFLQPEYENVVAPPAPYWEDYPSFGGPRWPTDRPPPDPRD